MGGRLSHLPTEITILAEICVDIALRWKTMRTLRATVTALSLNLKDVAMWTFTRRRIEGRSSGKLRKVALQIQYCDEVPMDWLTGWEE